MDKWGRQFMLKKNTMMPGVSPLWMCGKWFVYAGWLFLVLTFCCEWLLLCWNRLSWQYQYHISYNWCQPLYLTELKMMIMSLIWITKTRPCSCFGKCERTHSHTWRWSSCCWCSWIGWLLWWNVRWQTRGRRVHNETYFFDLDQDSMKILSYPNLKTHIKQKLCCQLCTGERCIWKSQWSKKLSNWQQSWCLPANTGHYFLIAPEHEDEKKIDSSDNFKINFYIILAMQILAKGLQTMSVFLGLLSICISEGNYKVGKNTG